MVLFGAGCIKSVSDLGSRLDGGNAPDIDANAPFDAQIDAGFDGSAMLDAEASVDGSVDGSFDSSIDGSVDAFIDGSDDAFIDASIDASTDAPSDAGPEPFQPTTIDIQCDTYWTGLADEPPPECRGRQVVSIVPVFSFGVFALDRSDEGVLTMAFSELEGPDFGRIRTLTFSEDAPTDVVAGPSIEPVASMGDVPGVDIAMVFERPNIHHLAYWYRSDIRHTIEYRTLRGDVLTEEQTVASGLGPNGVLDIALDREGRPNVVWHDDASGRVEARYELATGGFGGAFGIRTGTEPRLPGAGAVALAADLDGILHLGFQWTRNLLNSSPSYAQSDGLWSLSLTVDNNPQADRISGISTDITTIGEEIVMTYLDWVAGHGEVRMARFARGSTTPVITQHLQGLVMPDTPGRHPIALQADARGWLQLIVGETDRDGCTLLYQRQTRVGAELRWLTDRIDGVSGVTCEDLSVEMVLGADRRPHIVFWDPIRGEFRYATVLPT